MELEDEEFAISAKELEEEKKREKEEQAKKVRRNPQTPLSSLFDNSFSEDDIALAVCMVVILIITCVVVIFKVTIFTTFPSW